MDIHKVVLEVFFVLGAVTLAWLMYSVLLQYPYSDVMTMTNGVQTKSAVWAAADAFQIPFGSYYYMYCQMPNMRGDEEQCTALSEGINAGSDGYGYVVRLNDGTSKIGDGGTDGVTNNILGDIYMDLSEDPDTGIDGGNDVIMRYPVDNKDFYTTGWR